MNHTPKTQNTSGTNNNSAISPHKDNGLYSSVRILTVVIRMGCWKWFNEVLEEAGVEVTDKNRETVDETVHEYIGEQSRYGRCSADWRKARKEIKANQEMKSDLVKRLRSSA